MACLRCCSPFLQFQYYTGILCVICKRKKEKGKRGPEKGNAGGGRCPLGACVLHKGDEIDGRKEMADEGPKEKVQGEWKVAGL